MKNLIILIRQEINEIKGNEEGKDNEDNEKFNYPDEFDKNGWHKLCFKEDSEHMVPSFDFLMGLDSKNIVTLLNFHVFWMTKNNDGMDGVFNKVGAGWIYALLAVIDLPIHRQVQLQLRDLIIFLTKERVRLFNVSEEDKDWELLGAMNMLIVIIAKFFSQGKI